MPITFLDEPNSAPGITFLDEPKQPQPPQQPKLQTSAQGLPIHSAPAYGPDATAPTPRTGKMDWDELGSDVMDMLQPTEVRGEEAGEEAWVMRHPVAHFMYEMSLGNVDRIHRGTLGAVEQAQVASGGLSEEELKQRQGERGDEQLGYVNPLAAFGGGMMGETRTNYRDIMRNAGVGFSEDMPDADAYAAWHSPSGLKQLGKEFGAAVGQVGSDPLMIDAGISASRLRAATKAYKLGHQKIFTSMVKKGHNADEARSLADRSVKYMMSRHFDDEAIAGLKMVPKLNAKGDMVYAVSKDITAHARRTIGRRLNIPKAKQVNAQIDQAIEKLMGIAPRATSMVDDAAKAGAKAATQTAPAISSSGSKAAATLEAAADGRQALIPGAATVVHGTRGVEIPAQYVAMPRSMMQGSHVGGDMAANAQYPLTNTRDYGSSSEREKALAVRNGFNSMRHITDATDAAVGPVMVARIIDEEGIETIARLGGNTRGWAIENMTASQRTKLMELTNQRADRFGLEAPLPDADHELVRFLGEYDFRQPGERDRVQGIVDSLNPAPGKVQNAGEMASVDATHNLPVESFDGLDMQIDPADAQVWIAQRVARGELDANLRGQLSEKPAAAQDYVRRVVASRAFGAEQAPVVEFVQAQDSSGRMLRGMLEQAAPVLVRMRAKGMDDLADAMGRAAGTMVDDFGKNRNVQGALELAARQQEMDPKFGVVNAVARSLADNIATTAKGRVQVDDSLDATDMLWHRIEAAVEHYSGGADLFGESREPHEVIAEAVRMASQPAAAAPAAAPAAVAETPAQYGESVPAGLIGNQPGGFSPEEIQQRMASQFTNQAAGGTAQGRWEAIENTYRIAQAAQQAFPDEKLADMQLVTLSRGWGDNRKMVDQFMVPRSKARDLTAALEAQYPAGSGVRAGIEPSVKPFQPKAGEPTYKQWLAGTRPQFDEQGELVGRKSFKKPEPVDPQQMLALEREAQYGAAAPDASAAPVDAADDFVVPSEPALRAKLEASNVPDIDKAIAYERKALQAISNGSRTPYIREQLEMFPASVPQSANGTVAAPTAAVRPPVDPDEAAARRASGVYETLSKLHHNHTTPLDDRREVFQNELNHYRETVGAGETVSNLIASRYRNPFLAGGAGESWNVRGAIIESPRDLMALMMPLRSPYQEAMKVAYLDANKRIVDAQIVTIGILNASLVDPRVVFGRPPSGAMYVMVSHNHPSGDPGPSAEDLQITRQIQTAANTLGYDLLDHVVTDHDKYFSFAEESIIKLETGHAKERPAPKGLKGWKVDTDNLGTKAPWEVMPQDELTQVMDPAQLGAIVRPLRQIGKASAGHIVMVNSKNRIVGISQLPLDTPLTEIGAEVGRRLLDQGNAASFLVDWPEAFPKGKKKIEEMVAVGKQLQMRCLDAVAKDFSSLREEGLMQFAETPATYGSGVAEKPARYAVAKKTREQLKAAAKGPYALMGPANTEAPIAVRLTPAGSAKAVQPSDWQRMKLGGLEHVRPIEMPELHRMALQFGASLRLGRFRGGVRGYFKPGPGRELAIDQRLFRDPREAAQVMAHEIGHLSDYLPDEFMKRGNILGRIGSLRGYLKNQFGEGGVTNKEIREELIALTQWWKPYDEKAVSRHYDKYRKSSVELYADAVSVMFNDPKALKERAPRFWHQWIKYLERKPEVSAAVMDVWELMNKPEIELLQQRKHDVRTMFGAGEELMLRKADERRLQHESWRGWADRFKMQYYDVYAPIKDAAKRVEMAGGRVDPGSDPRILFDELPFADAPVFRLLQQAYEKAIGPLEARGFTQEMMGEYLFFNRVAHESYTKKDGIEGGRANLANPKGHTQGTARRQLMEMRLALGMDDFQALQSGMEKVQELVFGAVEEGVKAGTVNGEMFENIIKPNQYNYATFVSMKHLEADGSIPASIREQAGMFGDTINPLHATLIKSSLIIRWNQFNQAKAGAVKVLADLGEAVPARMGGPRHKDPAKPPVGKENLIVMVDGKPKFWVVDKQITEMMKGVGPAHMNTAIRLLNWGFREMVYPLLITYNPGFTAKNLVRDFKRTSRNLPAEFGRNPLVVGGKLLKAYGAAWSDGVARAKGETTPLLAEMMDNLALGNPQDTFVRNEARQDVFGQIMKRYGLMPDDDHDWINKYMPPVRRGLDGIAIMNATMEALPKTAAYKLLREELHMQPREAAAQVRNYLGTPNFAKRGQQAALLGAVRPFINICLRGLESDSKRLFDFRKGGQAREGKGTALIRWALGSGSVVLAKVAAERGLFGEKVQEIMAGVSEYRKTNYHIIPLGTAPGYDFGQKSVVMNIPMDETERLLNATLYKLLTSDQASWEQFTQIMDVGAGVFPGWNINGTIGSKWAQFLAGTNPRDDFRSRGILTNDEHLLGGVGATKTMLTWSARKVGAMNLIRIDTDAETVMEGVINSTPFVNSLFSVTDYGHREAQMETDELDAKLRATLKAQLVPEVEQARGRYRFLQRVGDQRTDTQEEEYRALGQWYRSAYSPAQEEAQELAHLDDLDAAKRIMGTISAP